VSLFQKKIINAFVFEGNIENLTLNDFEKLLFFEDFLSMRNKTTKTTKAQSTYIQLFKSNYYHK